MKRETARRVPQHLKDMGYEAVVRVGKPCRTEYVRHCPEPFSDIDAEVPPEVARQRLPALLDQERALGAAVTPYYAPHAEAIEKLRKANAELADENTPHMSRGMIRRLADRAAADVMTALRQEQPLA